MFFQSKLSISSNWSSINGIDASYCGNGLSKSFDYYDKILTFNIEESETRYISLIIDKAGLSFGDYFRLKTIKFVGNIPLNNIECPYVTFYYWDYDASNTY